MATWAQFEEREPEFAARVKARFDAGIHKTIATLRKDGAPRISGSELVFTGGEVTLGMMPGSMKLLDVRRDPRIAVHCPTVEPPGDESEPGRGWLGDAKLAGRVVETEPPAEMPGSGAFKIDITEVVLTYLGDPPDHIVIESWHPGRGLRRRKQV